MSIQPSHPIFPASINWQVIRFSGDQKNNVLPSMSSEGKGRSMGKERKDDFNINGQS